MDSQRDGCQLASENQKGLLLTLEVTCLYKTIMTRITRIAYNRANWRHPTGDAAQHEMEGSYTNTNRFGHEDWLFRDEWQIDGWRYAFLQGVNHSQAKLIREKKPFDVTLFTIEPDKRRRYVAQIKEVECLDETQAEEALEVFEKKGWLNVMKGEIQFIGGDVSALGNAKWARHILNVRFRLRNVHFFPEKTFATNADPVKKYNHYVLVDASTSEATLPRAIGRRGSADLPEESRGTYTRRGFGPVEVSPEHARMQRALMIELRKEYPHGKVEQESNFIDVLVRTNDELRLYEIKSDLAPRSVLRQAIGQLLEYSFFQVEPGPQNVTLIVVGRKPLEAADSSYLEHLCARYRLPLEYRVVSI